jgi:hypothetical protein
VYKKFLAASLQSTIDTLEEEAGNSNCGGTTQDFSEEAANAINSRKITSRKSKTSGQNRVYGFNTSVSTLPLSKRQTTSKGA